MTLENLQKQYEHLKGLVAGNYKSGNSVKDELIVEDAKRTMKRLLKKHSYLSEETESKSKGKK